MSRPIAPPKASVSLVRPTWCTAALGMDSDHTYLINVETGAACGTTKAKTFHQRVSCSRWVDSITLGAPALITLA